MKKFNIELELTDQEVKLLKNADWNDKQPKEPYGTTTEDIKIDLDKGTWERTFIYQWLYRKPPELKSIEDVFGYIKTFKRKEKLNSILKS